MSRIWRRTWATAASRPRLAAAAAIGLAAGLASARIGSGLRASTSAIIGWDVLCLAFTALVAVTMAGHTQDDIRRRARREDEGRGMILGLVILAAVASLGAIAAELSLAKADHGAVRIGHIAIAFGTVAASWLMVQLIFALHYAHEYYTGHKDTGRDREGLAFPGQEPPDYWDFIHFSVVIGVAAQTADIAFTEKTLRRLGTVHSLVAFVFNTVVVALTINLLAGLF